MAIEQHETINFNLKNLDSGTIIKLTAPKYRTLKVGLSITFTIVVLLIALKWGAVLSIDIRDIVAIFTSGIVCTTLVYHAFNLTMNYEINKIKIDYDENKIKFDRKVQSLNMITEWHKPEMTILTITIRDFLSEKNTDNNLSKLIDLPENIDSRKAIVTILNYFEKISLACEFKIADEAVLKDFFQGLFQFYYLNSKDFIQKRRRERNNTKIFERFEKYSTKWNETK